MTPEQAIAILTQSTAMLGATREQHLQIMKALQVLSDLVKGAQSDQPKSN